MRRSEPDAPGHYLCKQEPQDLGHGHEKQHWTTVHAKSQGRRVHKRPINRLRETSPRTEESISSGREIKADGATMIQSE
jgi:hypothetical protein